MEGTNGMSKGSSMHHLGEKNITKEDCRKNPLLVWKYPSKNGFILALNPPLIFVGNLLTKSNVSVVN